MYYSRTLEFHACEVVSCETCLACCKGIVVPFSLLPSSLNSHSFDTGQVENYERVCDMYARGRVASVNRYELLTRRVSEEKGTLQHHRCHFLGYKWDSWEDRGVFCLEAGLPWLTYPVGRSCSSNEWCFAWGSVWRSFYSIDNIYPGSQRP